MQRSKAKPVSARASREFTMAEVSAHNSASDCWIAVHGKVYNITNWLEYHPGGSLVITNVAGQDSTEAFLAYHPPSVVDTMLPRFQCGVVKDYKACAMREDYLATLQKMRAEGLMEPYWGFIIKRSLLHMAKLAVAVLLLLYGLSLNGGAGSTWWIMLSAVVLGMFWQQLAFIGHDFGHNYVSQQCDLDWYGNIFVTFFFGVSGQWWKKNHNVHHVVTNSITHDPDIQHLPFMAVDSKLFKGFFSSYYQKQFSFDRASQILVSFQHVLFLPIMSIARVNLYAHSFKLVLDPSSKVRSRFMEVSCIVCFWIWHVSLLRLLPTWSMMFLYLYVSHAIAGITHLQIILSHFAMPAFEDSEPLDCPDQERFVREQAATTMDVDCVEWMDWFHGGLQFQVEHHLFPRLPRHHLRYAMNKYIKPFLKRHDVEYHTHSFWDSIVIVYRHLRVAAMEARRQVGKSTNYLVPLINAEG